eukprot:s829_g15.t1
MAELARLPAALRELEAAIDAEVDFAVLRAVRQRLNEREFALPRDAVLLCRGSRQFGQRDLHMSLADLGICALTSPRSPGQVGCRNSGRDYWADLEQIAVFGG